MLKRVGALDYPADSVSLFIFSSNKFADGKVSDWLKEKVFSKVRFLSSSEGITGPMARKMAMQHGIDQNAEFVFFLDGYVQLTNGMTLKRLIESNKDLIAPGMSRFGKLWSNYWGAVATGKHFLTGKD